MTTKSPLVMVVDDEPHLCNILRRVLELEGYRAITAPDGEAALRLAEENKPDVILLDLVMPGINGREVCRRVREFSAETRIIYFTAKADPTDPVQFRELHREADGFIAKPATSKQILAKLNDVLHHPRKKPEHPPRSSSDSASFPRRPIP